MKILNKQPIKLEILIRNKMKNTTFFYISVILSTEFRLISTNIQYSIIHNERRNSIGQGNFDDHDNFDKKAKKCKLCIS